MHTFLILAILIFLGKAIAALSDRIKLPTVIGMIALGIALGPTGVGMIRTQELSPAEVSETLAEHHENIENIETLMTVFPRQMSFEIIRFLASIGVTVLLFMAGLETDLRTLARAGKASVLIAIGGVVIPFAMGFGLSLLFQPSNYVRAAVIGAISTATSVSVTAMSLISLKRVQSREGTTILTAAVIDDIIGIILLSVVVATISGDRRELYTSAAFIVGYLIAAIVIGWFVVPFVMNLSKKMDVTMGVNAIALSLMFFFAGVAEISRVASITGAYLAGVFVGRTQFRHTVREGLETIGHSFFIPLFFIFIGLQVNLTKGTFDWVFIALFILTGIAGKIIGAGAMARAARFSWRRSLAVGGGMVPRGEVALVIASIGLHYPNVLTSSAFTATVLLVVASSLVAPFLLARGFAGKESAHA
ncbi:MAG: cation:proton antiporter [Chitinivibrionales bacterium]|nr:cation:proton antiporter [Chitinivibrionales bacterium]MBD3356700.1 cation:proton antiporter [Chitinivibrionales bacterium]